jgi:hypothetical protein
MSEEVKQEGEFKIKTPSKPKNLGDNIGRYQSSGTKRRRKCRSNTRDK